VFELQLHQALHGLLVLADLDHRVGLVIPVGRRRGHRGHRGRGVELRDRGGLFLRVVLFLLAFLICQVTRTSLTDVIADGLWTKREHECEPKLQLARSNEISLSTDDEGAS
jgi:hypothetical protein